MLSFPYVTVISMHLLDLFSHACCLGLSILIIFWQALLMSRQPYCRKYKIGLLDWSFEKRNKTKAEKKKVMAMSHISWRYNTGFLLQKALSVFKLATFYIVPVLWWYSTTIPLLLFVLILTLQFSSFFLSEISGYHDPFNTRLQVFEIHCHWKSQHKRYLPYWFSVKALVFFF